MEPGGARFVHRPALDGVRAVAVAAVILYHLDYSWAKGGFLGVDVFFVLSGYLITSLLIGEHRSTGRVELGRFWLRRAKRLLPALLLVLVAVAVYAAFVASSDARGDLRADSIASLFYVANWRFILTEASYFDLFSEASPLRHVWSLAIEEQFYLAWPLVVFVALGARRSTGALVAATVVAAAASVAVMVVTFDAVDPSRAYFGTDARIHQPLLGALLAIGLPRAAGGWPRFRRAIGPAGAVAAVVLGASFVWTTDTGASYYRGGALGVAVVAAVVIAAASEAGSSPIGRALAARPLQWLGQISYGVYLWHWPMIVWLTPDRTGLSGAWLDAGRVAATLALSAASYRLVERPIRRGRYRDRLAVGGLPAAVGACLVVVLVGTAGATTNPFDQRTVFTLPPEAAADGIRVVMVGDSVADSIADALPEALPPTAAFSNLAIRGCGIATGVAVLPSGDIWEPSIACRDEVARLHSDLVARDRPDLVVWYSEWETVDRMEDGLVVRFGAEPHTAALARDLDAAVSRLTAEGAHVALILNVPRTEADPQRDEVDRDARAAALNDALRALASRAPDRVTVIDLDRDVCPGGPPCPRLVDGIELRPDGAHYSAAGSSWLAERIREHLEPLLARLTGSQ